MQFLQNHNSKLKILENPISNLFSIQLLRLGDAENLHRFISSNKSHLSAYFPVTLALNETPNDSSNYIKDRIRDVEQKTMYVFSIIEIKSNKIVGLLILKELNWNLLEGELAFCIDKDFEGKRITSWGVNEIINLACKDLGLISFRIIAHKTNFSSCGVALKNGFLWQETLINEFTPEGKPSRNMELYVLKKQ